MNDAPARAARAVLDDRPSGIFDVRRDGVAILTTDARLRDEIGRALSSNGRPFGGDELVGGAQAIVVEVVVDRARPIADAISELRRRARPDAAIVVLLRDGSTEVPRKEMVADAHRAGAFACLRLPLVAAELRSLLAAAGARAPMTQVADPSAFLDMRTHLATLGRISGGLSNELGTPVAALAMNLEMVVGECSRLAEVEGLLHGVLKANPATREELVASAASALITLSSQSELFDVLADARASVTRMRDLLTTMKELVGRAPRTMHVVDLADLARDVRKWIPKDLVEGVTIDELVEDPPVTAMANASLVMQVLLQLVSNAAQAAGELPSPRVLVHVYAAGDEAIVSVRDNGRGIPADEQEKIFEPFHTTRRGRGGMGLGLSLCREYTLQMGARLSVWSVPGRGACFRLHLRRA